MEKKKMNLSELKVKSFKTSLSNIRGGNTGESFTCPPPPNPGGGVPGWWTNVLCGNGGVSNNSCPDGGCHAE